LKTWCNPDTEHGCSHLLTAEVPALCEPTQNSLVAKNLFNFHTLYSTIRWLTPDQQ